MRNKLNNKAICILGMHRSGTSAVARAVNLLGVSLGNPENLIGGDKDSNPKGHWEHKQVNEIHDDILNALGRTWNDISPMPDKWLESPDISSYKKELEEMIIEEFTNEPLWGFKEPRTCLLIPLWNEILNSLGVDTNYVIVIRNPIDVANSLKKRDELSLNESLLLWQQHTLLSLKDTKGYDRCILHYDNLIHDWGPTLKKVSQSLSIPWPNDEKKFEEEMQSFLDPNLRHSSSTLNDLQELRVSNSVKQTYSLCQRANDDPEYLSSEEFAQKTEDFLQDFNMFSEILLPELRDSLHIKNKKIRTLQEDLVKRDSEIIIKDHKLENKDKLLENKDKLLENKDKLIENKEKLITDIMNTWSWKITKPLRWISNFISRAD